MVLGSDSLAPGEPTQRWLSEWTIDLYRRGEGLLAAIPAKALLTSFRSDVLSLTT
jgi:hypothetical protein